MKIVHVTPRFGPGGGIVAIVREMSHRLKARGDQVEVYTSNVDRPGHLVDDTEVAGLPVHRFPVGRSERLRFPLFTGLTDALEKSGADIIHAHNHRFGHVLQAALAARRARTPFVVSTYYHPAQRHEPGWKRAAIRLLDYGFGATAYRQARTLVVLSNFETARVHAFAPRARVRVIPPGIDLAAWSDPTGDRAAAPTLPTEYFVFSGRLARNKGLVHLVRALARMPSADRRPLVLVGPDFGLRPELEALARELGIPEALVFLGHVEDPRVYRTVLRGARALVLPSEWESFGVVLLEGMAARTPIVATAAGAIPEVLEDGRAGQLVPYADPDALAEALSGVIQQPGEAKAQVERAAGRVRDFDWDQATESLREVYRDAVAR